MKKSTFVTAYTLLVILIASCTQSNVVRKNDPNHQYDKRTRADLAAQQNFEMTKDPSTGEIPRDELWKAIEQLRTEQRSKGKAAISNISWEERGPNNVGGRTRAIMFDPTDADNNRVFAASIAGGLWVTEDIYASTPTWNVINDFLDNLAITGLAHDPQAPGVMYFGTGEGFFNIDAVQGDGIWRSIDSGATWTQLGNTTAYNYIQKIVVDSNSNIYAATRTAGLIMSSDSGNTWSVALDASGIASTDRVADIEIASNGDIYASFGLFTTDGVYKSSNQGSSWSQVYTSSGEHRIELACAPSDSDVVYMVSQSSSTYNAAAIRRTANGGTSWSALSNPTDAVGGTNFCRGQAWYDISLVVDPNDATAAYVGGIDLYKTTNSGTSWTQVSHWYGGGGYPEVHADQHIALFANGSSDSIFFGNDGGIYISEDATSSTPGFEHIVSGYNVSQFYAGAMHPDANENHLLSGSQDNGTQLIKGPQVNSTFEVTGGDGGFCHIDQYNPSYQFTAYTGSNINRSNNGGVGFSSLLSSSAGLFINPTDYDNNTQVLYGGTTGGFWRITSARTSTTATTKTGPWSDDVSALIVDPNTVNRLYIGTESGNVYLVNNATAGNPTETNITSGSFPSGAYVSSIAVEDGDADHLMVTFSNYSVNSIWESTNGGTSWTSIEGNLPNIPIRWAIFSPMGGDSAFIATELGVWTTDNLNGGSTNWAATNTGLANVRTDMLQYRSSDSTIMAITHGRGIYTYSFAVAESADFTSDITTIYPCQTVQFTDASQNATSWQWDLNGDGAIDATDQNPSWIYRDSGRCDVTLIINGTDTMEKTEFIRVLPRLGTPYATSDGGSFDTNKHHFGSEITTGFVDVWESGNPSNTIATTSSGNNVWKTDLDADILLGDYTCALYTPSFNLTTAGTYTLTFDYRMDQLYSNAPMGAWVEYSIDGLSWSQLGTYNAGNNWYSTTTHDLAPSGTCWSHTQTSYVTATQDISSLAGNDDVRFRIMFTVSSGYNGGYDQDGFAIDDFAISGPSNDPQEWEVETALNATATAALGPNQTVNFISSDCKIIATIENKTAHDFGSTTVSIDHAGSNTMDFDTNTLTVNEIFEKTILVTPTTNNTSANVDVTIYYSNTEGGNWKSTTGWTYNDLTQIKTPNSIASGTVATATVGASPGFDSTYNGNNLALTASFSNGFSGFAAGHSGAATPVPVELLDFNGYRTAGASHLSWSTASEINSSHFLIERLKNNRYQTIGTVQAAGHSTAVLSYEFNDFSNQTESVIYYRLTSVDYDRSIQHSEILRLEIDKGRQLRIGPNPSSGFLKLHSDFDIHHELEYSIYALDGRELQSGLTTANGTIDLDNLKNGVYLIAIRQEGVVIKQQKFLLQ